MQPCPVAPEPADRRPCRGDRQRHQLAGGDLARAAMALAELEPQKGRGVRFRLDAPDGTITVIDESYNANPASVRAALALLGQAKPGRGGRRIAVLGDMLELGDESPRLHAELAGVVDESGTNIVYACGPGMAHLWEALPDARRGAYAETEVEVSLREAAYGAHRELNVQNVKNCEDCEAVGGTDTHTCGTCGGAGAVRTVRQSILGQMVSTQACSAC
ncbi:MAG: hypothetical protein KY442_11385, partial [Proteobacteria bacterium]|nr:hypothetical protein [Pseudomonadota bacterium]